MKIKIKDLKLKEGKKAKTRIQASRAFFCQALLTNWPKGLKKLYKIEEKLRDQAQYNTKYGDWKAQAIEWMNFINCMCYPESAGKYKKEANKFMDKWPTKGKPLLHRSLVMSSLLIEGYSVLDSAEAFDCWLEEGRENRCYPGGYYMRDNGVVDVPKRDGGGTIEADDFAIWKKPKKHKKEPQVRCYGKELEVDREMKQTQLWLDLYKR